LEYNINVFDQIFDLVYYSEGGFDYNSVYDMPVNLRSYYYRKLDDIIKKKNAEIEKANQKRK
jgi:hypothetical protein